MISFSHPLLLVLVLPAWWVMRRTVPARGSRWILRCCILLALVVLVANPVSELVDSGQTTVLLVDRSRSVAPSVKSIELGLRQQAAAEQRPEDQFFVVGFGVESLVEFAPNRPPAPGSAADPDETNLHAAVAAALDLVPSTQRGRVLLISDGLASDAASDELLARIGRQRVPIDFLIPAALERPESDVALRAVRYVTANESIEFELEIHAVEAQRRTLQITRNRSTLASRQLALTAGLQRITWTDTPPADSPRYSRYTFELDSLGDMAPGDNSWQTWVPTSSAHSVLALNSDGADTEWVSLLREAGISVRVAAPDDSQFALDRLIGYDACLLEHIPMHDADSTRAESLVRYVERLGGGLMVTGRAGAEAGPMVFRFNPLESLLPVSVRPLAISERAPCAVVVLVDPTAWEGAEVDPDLKLTPLQESLVTLAQALDPADRLAIVATKIPDPVVLPLSSTVRMRDVHEAVSQLGLSHDPAEFTRALTAAWDILSRAPQANKHLMLLLNAGMLSDWPLAPSDPLNNPIDGATITVFTWGEIAQARLKKIILATAQWRATRDAKALGDLLRQDFESVTGGSDMNRSTRLLHASPDAVQEHGEPLPVVAAFHAAGLREGATPILAAEGIAGQPLAAHWDQSLGRTAAVLFELPSPRVPSAEWDRLRGVLADEIRWVARLDEPVGAAIDVVTDQSGRRVTFSMPRGAIDRHGDPALVELHLVRADDRPVPGPQAFRPDADRLVASVDLVRAGDYYPVIRLRNRILARAAPVCLPRSPEFLRAARPQEGRAVLERLARESRGHEWTRGEPLFSSPERQLVSRSGGLAWIVAILIVLDVADRRLGLAQRVDGHWRRWVTRRVNVQDEPVARPATDPFEEAKTRLRRRLRR